MYSVQSFAGRGVIVQHYVCAVRKSTRVHTVMALLVCHGYRVAKRSPPLLPESGSSTGIAAANY